MITLDQLRQWNKDSNVRAILAVIRAGESSEADSAYTILFGGQHFDSSAGWAHPNTIVSVGGYHSTAAGAYQFLYSTWAELAKRYSFPDFSPEYQDLGAIALIAEHAAIADVMAGDLVAALPKIGRVWASMPGSLYGQPTIAIAKAEGIFRQYGGLLVGSAAPSPPVADIPAPTAPSKPAGAKMPILALISAFGPIISQLIPQVTKLFGLGGTEVADRNLSAAQLVFDTVTKAAGATNVQEAVEKMQADPTLAKTVQEAVVTHPDIIGLLEVGGGIEKARESGLAIQNAERPFWYNPIFWITMGFFPMMYMIVGSILFTTSGDNMGLAPGVAKPYWALVGFDAQTRAGLINLVVGMVFGGILGVWFGTSYGSQRKTELAAVADVKAP